MKKQLMWILLCISVSLTAQQADSIHWAIANYDYETALRLISGKNPTTQLTLLKARALKGLNRYTEAAEALRQVVAEEPGNFRTLIEMAECEKQAGRFAESLKNYEQALTLVPGNKYVQLQRITLLFTIEQYDRALAACRETMKNDSSTVVLRLMAQAQERAMKIDSALHYYKTIVEKEPYDYFSVAKLAGFYMGLNNPADAIVVTEKYREKDSTNIYVNRQNAQAYCLAKDYKEAINRYEYLVSRGDSSRMTCYYLGICYYAEEDLYAAHDFLRMAHKYDPKNINILYYLGKTCAKTSWKKEGVDLLNEAINIATPSDSTMTHLYNGLIDCCKLAGMYNEQIEAYKMVHKYNPQKHVTLYNIGAVYQDYLKDNKNAEKYLEMFAKTRPKTTGSTSQPVDEKVKVNEPSYYEVTEKRLSDIRQEQFFKGEHKQSKNSYPGAD